MVIELILRRSDGGTRVARIFRILTGKSAFPPPPTTHPAPTRATFSSQAEAHRNLPTLNSPDLVSVHIMRPVANSKHNSPQV